MSDFSGFIDPDPKYWKNCDLCNARYYNGMQKRPFYCGDCKSVPAISADDVIDAHNVLKKTLTGLGLMVICGVKIQYWA